jgi:hypothetical protein
MKFNRANYINYLEFNLQNLASSIDMPINDIENLTIEQFFESIDLAYPFGDSLENNPVAQSYLNNPIKEARKKAKNRAMINLYYYELNKKKV